MKHIGNVYVFVNKILILLYVILMLLIWYSKGTEYTINELLIPVTLCAVIIMIGIDIIIKSVFWVFSPSYDSEGIRRLGIALGTVVSITFLLVLPFLKSEYLVLQDDGSFMCIEKWQLLLLIFPLFILPASLVRLIYWVVVGFRTK